MTHKEYEANLAAARKAKVGDKWRHIKTPRYTVTIIKIWRIKNPQIQYGEKGFAERVIAVEGFARKFEPVKTHSPQDATVRNVRASNKRDAALAVRVKRLESAIKQLQKGT